MDSGEYSNLGARGKDFQKLMLSKKKSFDFVLQFFLQKSWCSPKKKRFSIQFDLRFPYFAPKIKVFSKKKKKRKKKRSSLQFDLVFPYFPPKVKVFSKEKKGLHLESISLFSTFSSRLHHNP